VAMPWPKVPSREGHRTRGRCPPVTPFSGHRQPRHRGCQCAALGTAGSPVWRWSPRTAGR